MGSDKERIAWQFPTEFIKHISSQTNWHHGSIPASASFWTVSKVPLFGPQGQNHLEAGGKSPKPKTETKNPEHRTQNHSEFVGSKPGLCLGITRNQSRDHRRTFESSPVHLVHKSTDPQIAWFVVWDQKSPPNSRLISKKYPAARLSLFPSKTWIFPTLWFAPPQPKRDWQSWF